MDETEWLGQYDPKALRERVLEKEAVRKMPVSVNGDSTTRWPKNVDASQIGATLNEVGDRPALERMMRELREAEEREMCTAVAYGEMRNHRDATGRHKRWTELTPSERFLWRELFNRSFEAAREYARNRGVDSKSQDKVGPKPPGPVASFMLVANTIGGMSEGDYERFVDDLRAMTQVNP